jgi:hypothetical protein
LCAKVHDILPFVVPVHFKGEAIFSSNTNKSILKGACECIAQGLVAGGTSAPRVSAQPLTKLCFVHVCCFFAATRAGNKARAVGNMAFIKMALIALCKMRNAAGWVAKIFPQDAP